MCTLIAGIGVLGAGTLVIGANRDESPDRAATTPLVLRERPRVVGGRDVAGGGTWLAVREARFVAALLNRRPIPAASGGAASVEAAPRDASLRSRGLLCLDAAAAPPAFDAPTVLDPGTGERYPARRDAALRLIERDAYAPCTLVGLEVGGETWAIHAGHGGAPRVLPLDSGWHVVTHVDPDDPTEARTAWLLARLRDWAPAGAEEALAGLAALLRLHGEGSAGGATARDASSPTAPAICLHGARFPTVSSSLLALGVPSGPRYLHAAGAPCVTPYEDVSALLA